MVKILVIDEAYAGRVLTIQDETPAFQIPILSSEEDAQPYVVDYTVNKNFSLFGSPLPIAHNCSVENSPTVLMNFFSSRIPQLKDVITNG